MCDLCYVQGKTIRVLGAELYSLKIELLSSVPQNVTVFEDRAYKEVIKLKQAPEGSKLIRPVSLKEKEM